MLLPGFTNIIPLNTVYESGILTVSSPWQYIFYSAAVLALAWIIVKSQAVALVRTHTMLKEKERALSQIENQRTELELKNKSITESLTYAQRIQEALLPSETYLQKCFADSFIFYHPRDIVSGDFYWVGQRDGRFFIAAADCTGHGVPGALMSMIGHDLLEKTVIMEGAEHPSEILDLMSFSLAEMFTREKNIGTVIRDGMDIGVCMVDTERELIEYAGSFFPLYIIRDSRLIELKSDKFTLGMTPKGFSYQNHKLELKKGDKIYMFSDGYVDQFGGEENKKFMYRRFRYLLLNIHKFPMADQKSILEENIRTWMGPYPQIDDMLIIGFRPL
jgi:serine phosphatase RsbU (regulator of sigma subunit)